MAQRTAIGLAEPPQSTLDDISRRTMSWLIGINASIGEDAATQKLQSLVCGVLCTALASRHDLLAGHDLEDLLAAVGSLELDDLMACEGGLVLLAHYLLSSMRVDVSECFQEYAEIAADAILTSEAAHCLNTYHAHWLLNRLGSAPPPMKPVLEFDSLEHLIRADAGSLWNALRLIGAESEYGLTSVNIPTSLRKAFEIRTYVAFREYDLLLGAALLRTLHYLGDRSSLVLRSSRKFLLDQFGSDGRFGEYRNEVSRIRTVSPGYADHRLYLPVTLACLWALAETSVPGYRAYHLSTQFLG